MLKYSQVTPPPLSLAVLCGGSSSEREISLESGKAILNALSSLGHSCAKIDPADTDPKQVNWLDYDAAVIALHGRYGEDGELQKLLEHNGVPFTGSRSRSSELAFSKIDAKQQFVSKNIPTPEFAAIKDSDDASRIADFAQAIGYPVVVKPNSEGSSFGVTIVPSADRLPAALAKCFQFGSRAIIERAIVGTEWTVAVIDDLPLPPLQIKPARSFYDFRAKYEDDSTQYVFDSFESDLIDQIREVGLQACRCLGTSGVARADIRLDGYKRPWVLEVNTIPGMTSHSLVPMAAQKAGISFPELCQRMVTGCLKQRSLRKSA